MLPAKQLVNEMRIYILNYFFFRNRLCEGLAHIQYGDDYAERRVN